MVTPHGKKYTVLFAILQGAFWSSNCMLYTFLINIYAEYGISMLMAGLTLTLFSLVTILVQPLMGYISDTFLPAKRLLIMCFAAAAALSLVLPFCLRSSQWLGIAAFVLVSAFDYSIYTVIDVWAIKTISENPGMEFAVVRAGGSVSFAVTALVMGTVINTAGVNILFIGHFVMMLFCIGAALFLKEYPCANSRKYPGSRLVNAPAGDSLFSAIKQLFTNVRYLVAVLALAVFQFAMRVTQSYMTVIIEHFGGNSQHMGITLFLGALTEALVLIAIGKLISRGANLTYTYWSFLCVAAVRIACLLIPGGVLVPMLSQMIQACAIGIYLRVFPDYISSVTPKHLTATACTFAIALSIGAGSLPGNMLGGWMMEQHGVDSYIAVSAIISIISIILFLPSVLAEHRRKQSGEKEPTV